MNERVPVLQVTDLTFGYGKEEPVFKNLSFSVSESELVCVLGANGAGKTTLLNCVIGGLKPRSGEIRYSGTPLKEMKTRDLYRSFAYVPQRISSVQSYTVLESILFHLTGERNVFQAPGKHEIEKAESILETWDLRHLTNKPLGELSGGELQLVRIAGAAVKEPKILILDEPESGLDYRNQMLVLDRIRSLSSRSIACLMNTHYPEHAYRYADRVVLFPRKTESGPSDVLFGPTEQMITEENIKNVFGVDAVIRDESMDGTTVRSVVPIRISDITKKKENG